MLDAIKGFWQDEEGMGTLEVILIAAALIVVALMFKGRLKIWVGNLLDQGENKTQDAFN